MRQGKYPCICSLQIKGYCVYDPSNIFKIFSLIAARTLFVKLNAMVFLLRPFPEVEIAKFF